MKLLTLNDIDEKIQPKIYVQEYKKQEMIDGVKIMNLENIVDEQGEFLEVIRVKENGEVEHFPGFKIKQVNCSILYAKTIKAWHLHFKQDEIWYIVPPNHLLIGLWDVRKNSKTKGKTMRLVLGGGKFQLLYIPAGIAHGSANLTEKRVNVWYFTNQHFDPVKPDERRISWDAQGADFWSPQRV